jgi:ribosomal protein S8
MSLVNLAHICSHLQNVSKARLGLTSIPMTRLHLNLALGLQKQGFISTVQVAGPTPPVPNRASNPHPTPKARAKLEEKLAVEPWLAFDFRESDLLSNRERRKQAKDVDADRVLDAVPENPAQRRIWLGMKYWNNEPVLSEMGLISKPTRRIKMGVQDIAKIARGRRAGYVQGLTRPGECLFVSTDKGIFESRECVERTLGGLLLCRVL